MLFCADCSLLKAASTGAAELAAALDPGAESESGKTLQADVGCLFHVCRHVHCPACQVKLLVSPVRRKQLEWKPELLSKDALCLSDVDIGQILSNEKVWLMRPKMHNKGGLYALLNVGTSGLHGVVMLEGCIQIPKEEFMKHEQKHRMKHDDNLLKCRGRFVYAWVLQDVLPFKELLFAQKLTTEPDDWAKLRKSDHALAICALRDALTLNTVMAHPSLLQDDEPIHANETTSLGIDVEDAAWCVECCSLCHGLDTPCCYAFKFCYVVKFCYMVEFCYVALHCMGCDVCNFPEDTAVWQEVFRLAHRILPVVKKYPQSMLFKGVPVSVRSTCSGIGAVEESLAMIQAACSEFTSNTVSFCDKHAGCQSFLAQRHDCHARGCHVFKDMLHWLPRETRATIEAGIMATPNII
jgi:hypothetical protein